MKHKWDTEMTRIQITLRTVFRSLCAVCDHYYSLLVCMSAASSVPVQRYINSARIVSQIIVLLRFCGVWVWCNTSYRVVRNAVFRTTRRWHEIDSNLISTTAVRSDAGQLSSYEHEDEDDVGRVDERRVLPALYQQRPVDRPQPGYGVLRVELTQSTSARRRRRLRTETAATAATE